MAVNRRYMTLARFKELSVMPSPDVDAVEAIEPGYVQKRLDTRAGWLNSRLAKRYAVPFGTDDANPANARSDLPEAIEDWLVRIVTPEVYAKRGVNPSSGEIWFEELVIKPAVDAIAEVREAADAEGGLFDLPMLKSLDPGGGQTRSIPLVYTEASPYVWTDVQAAAARDEDTNGTGT